MHRRTHTRRCRHIDTPNRSNAVCNQAYQRRGCSLDCFSQLGNTAQTQLNFESSPDKNLVCKQASQSSQITNRVVFSITGESTSIGCEGTTTLQWKRAAEGCQKELFYIPVAVFSMPGVLLACLRSVTHLHVCLPGR